jgi:hypothetical protein
MTEESRKMRRPLKAENPGRCSLVFSFAEQLSPDRNLGAPEPDFPKWVSKVFFADLGTAHDWYAFDGLSQEERRAWRLCHDAIEATSNLLELYGENPQLFQKVASKLSFLPCLMSWHPDAERFNRHLYEFSQLGQQSMYCELRHNAKHLVRQPWPVRYAYAIIATIDLTLDTYGEMLPLWAEIPGYGVRHPISSDEIEAALARMGCNQEKKEQIRQEYRGAYRILPKWTKGLEKINQPISKESVLDYWRTGKEMILEEIPNFHERSEWKDYYRRQYKDGAKPGAVQHAIFKDILAALKTIAGVNRTGLKKA